jgi:hypothetical protein
LALKDEYFKKNDCPGDVYHISADKTVKRFKETPFTFTNYENECNILKLVKDHPGTIKFIGPHTIS